MDLMHSIYKLLHISDKPSVKVYHGYGDNKQVLVYGHLFRLSPTGRKRYRKNFITNTFALLRLFVIKPYRNTRVRINWYGKEITTTTATDGFFKLEWDLEDPLEPGWHVITVDMLSSTGEVVTSGNGKLHVPYSTQYGCISDIDDTFLISHSSTIFKRLYVLLTENAYTRKPFKGVIEHYKYLANAATIPEKPNPFFYVSSSEWNLYDYIRDFSEKNEMPMGVYLLSQIKQLNQLFKTGQTKHSGKYIRIVRILKAYPRHRFILLGDDTQQDPYIYASIIKDFPGQIIAIYLRRVNIKNTEKVKEVIKEYSHAGIEYCYFTNSEEAIQHTKSLNLLMEKKKPV